MPTYVEIAVNVPQVTDVFHYHLPADLAGKTGAGHLVEVPFGPRQVQGVVLREVAEPAVAETRPVTGLIDPRPGPDTRQIALATYLSEHTLAPLASCLALMIPPGLSQEVDSLYSLSSPASPPASLSPLQARLLKLAAAAWSVTRPPNRPRFSQTELAGRSPGPGPAGAVHPRDLFSPRRPSAQNLSAPRSWPSRGLLPRPSCQTWGGQARLPFNAARPFYGS